MPWWHAESGGITIEVHVQPGASRTEVAGLHGGRLKIRIAARALENRANAELVRFLAGQFAVAKRDVSIESGEKSRTKRVLIRGSSRAPAVLLKSDT